MPASRPALAALDRRRFILDLGRGSLGIAVFGLAACSPSGSAAPSVSAGASSPAAGSATPDASGPALSPATQDPGTGGSPSASAATDGFAWQRVDRGFVSAYVLVRDGEAVVVDTGTEGSGGAIEAALGEVGLGWGDVAHVVLTHHHGDHAGGLGEVLEAATAAQGAIGAEDLAAVTSPRDLRALADGDDVLGLRIVATPGHTPGHIAVLDPIGGILVAGDALGTQSGRAIAPNAQFTQDMAVAEASVRALAELTFETLLVGHGAPIETGGRAAVEALAASL